MYYVRKLIAGALLVGVALGLGGCFHHNQAVYAEPLPPPVSKPLKRRTDLASASTKALWGT